MGVWEAGISEYLTVKDPTGDYIEHIDCWGKLLNETTILIDSFPAESKFAKDLDAVADYYASQVCRSKNVYILYPTLS